MNDAQLTKSHFQIKLMLVNETNPHLRNLWGNISRNPIEMSDLPGDVKCDRTFTNSHLAIREGCLEWPLTNANNQTESKGVLEKAFVSRRVFQS